MAAAVIVQWPESGVWEQMLYTVVDGQAAPFAMQSFDTFGEALSDSCEKTKTAPGDFLEVDEENVERYILDSTRNEWRPSDYKAVQLKRRELL